MNNQIHTVVMSLRNGGDFSFFDVDLLAFHLHKQWDKKKGKLRVLCLFDNITKEQELENVTLLPSFNRTWRGW